MKRKALVSAILVIMTSAALARLRQWSVSERPSLPLPEAYGCALAALGTQTNQYYCLRAECIIARSSRGEWLFTFGSTNGGLKSAFVFFDKKTQIEDGLPAF